MVKSWRFFSKLRVLNVVRFAVSLEELKLRSVSSDTLLWMTVTDDSGNIFMSG